MKFGSITIIQNVGQRMDTLAVPHHRWSSRIFMARRLCCVFETLKWEVLPHPPYSPDIAPSDYYLFRSMQHGLADQHFSNYDEVKKWIDEWIATKEPAFFGDGIRQLPERWGKVATDNTLNIEGFRSLKYTTPVWSHHTQSIAFFPKRLGLGFCFGNWPSRPHDFWRIGLLKCFDFLSKVTIRCKNDFFSCLESSPSQGNSTLRHLEMFRKFLLRLGTVLIQQSLLFSVFELLVRFSTWFIIKFEIATLEFFKPPVTLRFAQSVVAVNFLEHSVGFSGTFLPVEGEQQNFPQKRTFWLGNRHFQRAPEIFHDLNFSKTPRMLMPRESKNKMPSTEPPSAQIKLHSALWQPFSRFILIDLVYK
ncbi:hypothetical protein LAZ67_21000083 [Cordylochernes scorpioides]|uniref:Mariner Mos1 transposase n=1 Tax=Cordylochernes scorpioides TaxID=51811 RepID=A0ABY6LL81_9ARAC|nr:hypothetical protein LAZ67_21000083 [Cordylochernes scorpioides]